MSASPQTRTIVALDFPSASAALDLADRLDPSACRVKVGKELFTRAGPAIVETLATRGFDIFLDLKYHDIPNTVAGACAAAADLGVWMLNVHAAGGSAMMRAAHERVSQAPARPLLIAVTVLTSLDAGDLAAIGCAGEPGERVLTLAQLALQAGLDGVVCSPQEAATLRAQLGPAPLLVTPGVRPATSEGGDQKRTMTPAEALAAGADHLVIGRPITAAADPMQVLDEIQSALSAARAGTA